MSIYDPKHLTVTPYIPRDRDERLSKLVEEMGEFIQIYGKAGRFGMGSHHPITLENNAVAMVRELQDILNSLSPVLLDLKDYINLIEAQTDG